jgi:hypothetical protein
MVAPDPHPKVLAVSRCAGPAHAWLRQDLGQGLPSRGDHHVRGKVHVVTCFDCPRLSSDACSPQYSDGGNVGSIRSIKGIPGGPLDGKMLTETCICNKDGHTYAHNYDVAPYGTDGYPFDFEVENYQGTFAVDAVDAGTSIITYSSHYSSADVPGTQAMLNGFLEPVRSSRASAALEPVWRCRHPECRAADVLRPVRSDMMMCIRFSLGSRPQPRARPRRERRRKRSSPWMSRTRSLSSPAREPPPKHSSPNAAPQRLLSPAVLPAACVGARARGGGGGGACVQIAWYRRCDGAAPGRGRHQGRARRALHGRARVGQG